jgi:uncharacterized membrane protein (UPF0127 family)
MRIQRIDIKGLPIKAVICESMADRKAGLQGVLIGPRECMVFPFGTPRPGLHFHMGSVAYPIDIVWTKGGVVTKIVTGRPGVTASWVGAGDTVFEFLAGWCDAHDVRVGSRLTTESQATYNLLRTLTEADKEPVDVTPTGIKTASGSRHLEAIISVLADMITRGVANTLIEAKANQLLGQCTYGDRDRVVRVLHRMHGDRSLIVLRAQMNSEAPFSYDKSVGANPPVSDDAVGQIPADSLGTGTTYPIPLKQSFGYDPLLEQTGTGTRPASKVAAGEIHIKDRVKATDDVDGLRRDDKGVVMEIQGDAVKVRFDGEPLPRWIDRSILTVDKAADDVEKEIEEKEKGDGGGEGAPAGGEDGGEAADGGLAELLSALGGLATV